jgi:hypothetical protein
MPKRNVNPNPTVPNLREVPKRSKRVISWSQVSPTLLHWFTATICDDGSAVLYGRTMDETTLSILVLCGNDKWRKYCSHIADVPDALYDILDEMQVDYTPPEGA